MRINGKALLQIIFILTLAVLLASGCTKKDVPQKTIQSGGVDQPSDAQINDSSRYLKAVFDETDCESDIVYRETEDFQGEMVELVLDVYQPQGDTAVNRPAIVFLHAGGLIMGSKDVDGIEKWLAEDFALRGYVTTVINYRLRHYPLTDFQGAFADATEDAAAAVDWLVINSEKYGVDENNIALVGYSAGAGMATILAYNDEQNISWNKESIKGVVSISGGCGLCDPAMGDPPCLLIHGTEDHVAAPYSNSVTLLETLHDAGIDAELYSLEGVDHDVYPYHIEILDKITDFFYQVMISPADASKPSEK